MTSPSLDLSLNPAKDTRAARWRDVDTPSPSPSLGETTSSAMACEAPAPLWYEPVLRRTVDVSVGTRDASRSVPGEEAGTAQAPCAAPRAIFEAAPAAASSARLAPDSKIPVLTRAVPWNDEAAVPVTANLLAVLLHETDTFLVPAGAILRGDLKAACVHVKGQVHGNVTATEGPLLVDQDAVVHGSVQTSGMLIIAGQVHAKRPSLVAVRAEGPLHLGATAVITGEVRYTEVNLHEGAQVEGRMRPC